MKRRLISGYLILLAVCYGSSAQQISLSGTVVRNDTAVNKTVTQTPVAGCSVSLKKAGISTTTNSQGKFALVATSARVGVVGSSERFVKFINGELTFDYSRSMGPCNVELYNCLGRKVASVVNGTMKDGFYRLGLEKWLSGKSLNTVYIVRLRMGGVQNAFRFLGVGKNGGRGTASVMLQGTETYLAKRDAAAVDTLMIRKIGYFSMSLPILDYTAGDLGKTVMPTVPPPPGMKFISGGTFQMGQVGIQEPVHGVTLSDFCIDTTPVTQADYLALMAVNPSYFTGDKRPVEMVTWFDAVLYCNKRSKRDGLDTVYSYASVSGTPGNGCSALGGLSIDLSKTGYRLPTEAQYEYALRAGTTTKCFWGDDSSAGGNYAWYYANSGNTTQPVATKLPNPWGLYDMAGNVWEWVNDWYAVYPATSQTDPVGPATVGYRVLRGGSFLDTRPLYIRSAERTDFPPEYRVQDSGFRCVLPAK